MNALLQVVTIRDLNANQKAKEDALNAANALMRERIAALSDARRAATSDPCDYNKARVQQVTAELDEVKADIGSIKQDLRLAGRAVREFVYHAKPAINGKGKSIRH